MRLILLVTICFFSSCRDKTSPVVKPADSADNAAEEQTLLQNTEGNTIATRIAPPEGYTRQELDSKSFQHYLRNLPLKEKGANVQYYNGNSKSNNGIYTDVVDLPIGTRDLHQCADAVMRLRAEYLWGQNRYGDIHFNFTNGFRFDYREWMKGKRIRIKDNKTWWTDRRLPSNTPDDFWNYLEQLFMYAGTASLEKELVRIGVEEADCGDILIQGGFPGHAVIIVDKVVNAQGDARYLLAQSYMPAQEIQILQNPSNDKESPWYEISEGQISTPEWTFTSSDLKRF